LIYAIGDIHGHHWKLVQLLAALPLLDEDRLVFIGDYIDRGPESRQVIELLIELRRTRPDTVFLRGNHEEMMLQAKKWKHDFARTALWMGNGGSETMDSYPRTARGWIERIPIEHWEFLEATTLEFWLGPYLFVHAGILPPGAKWPYDDDPRLWVREEFVNYRGNLGATVIFGHTPQKSGRPLRMDNKIGIDTASAYGGPLTAVALDESGENEPKFYQA
jgi:serine/threonine protein phosphatase 1